MKTINFWVILLSHYSEIDDKIYAMNLYDLNIQGQLTAKHQSSQLGSNLIVLVKPKRNS